MKTHRESVACILIAICILGCGPKPIVRMPTPKGPVGDYELLQFPRSDLNPGSILTFYNDVENLEGEASLCFPHTPVISGDAQLWSFNVQTTDSLELGLKLVPADSSAVQMSAGLKRVGINKLSIAALGPARTRTMELARIRSVVQRQLQRIKKVQDDRNNETAEPEGRFDSGIPQETVDAWEACMYAVAFGNFVVASVLEADSFRIHFERTATGSNGLSSKVLKSVGVRFGRAVRVEESGDLVVQRPLVLGYKGLPLKIIKNTNPGGAEGTYWTFERLELGDLVGREGIQAHKTAVTRLKDDGETQ